ncbi:MAG: MFS transporter [Anaerolineales bacterium]|nr:MFS transporter [Anaerolineales bacterium]
MKNSIAKKRNTPQQIFSIASGHLFHDLYGSFLAPLLPTLMENLSINLTAAGILTSVSRLPSIFNPVVGYLADKTGAKYFVIFAPAVTATLMSLLGKADTVYTLAIILFFSGFSSTAFHASSPGLIAKASEKRKGYGLSLYMAGGGIGRSLGPILVVWAVSMWGLDGLARLMFLGWGVSLILFIQFRKFNFTPQPTHSLRAALPLFRRFFFPLALVLILRSALIASLSTYLPIFMVQSGAQFWLAGAALSILEISGVAGALILGPVSDKIGRKKTINLSMFFSATLMPLYLLAKGWLVFPLIVLLGFFSISSGTLFMALVQDNFQEHRSTGNSVYILISFLSNAIMLVSIGFVGDQLGLRSAYWISAAAALLSIPALQLLPSVDG